MGLKQRVMGGTRVQVSRTTHRKKKTWHVCATRSSFGRPVAAATVFERSLPRNASRLLKARRILSRWANGNWHCVGQSAGVLAVHVQAISSVAIDTGVITGESTQTWDCARGCRGHRRVH